MRKGRRMSEQAGYIMFFVMLRFSLPSIHWLTRAACAVDFSIRFPTCVQHKTMLSGLTSSAFFFRTLHTNIDRWRLNTDFKANNAPRVWL